MSLLKVKNCPLLVKHHGCLDMVMPSMDGSYYQMGNESRENYKMKVVYDGSIVNIMNYFHGGRIIRS